MYQGEYSTTIDGVPVFDDTVTFTSRVRSAYLKTVFDADVPILGFPEEDVLFCDFMTAPRTSIFGVKASLQLSPTFVKLVSWYDSEWG